MEPVDLEQLRAWVEEWRENDPYEVEATRAARFLLSLVDGGGRLIVEVACGHRPEDECDVFGYGWTDIPGNSDTQRYRQLGNAVAVPVVEWLMRRIVEVSG